MTKHALSYISIAALVLPGLSAAMPLEGLPVVEKLMEKFEDRIPNQYIITLKENVDAETVSNDITKRVGGQRLGVFKNAMKGFVLNIPGTSIEELLKDPNVESVTPDYRIEAFQRWSWPSFGTPKPSQTIPTGVARMFAVGKTNKGTGVNVAVLDTGIDTNHPDLKANIAGGKNCSTGSSYTDGNGHGTHVAGTIAALNNNEGVVGVAPEAKLWSVRVLDNGGSGSWSSIICGVDFVTANASKIKVANLSLGGAGTDGPCSSSVLHQAICNSVSAGVTYVVAAGNDGKDLKGYVPATFDEVITVTALDDTNSKPCGGGGSNSYGSDDTFASFSNYATVQADLDRLIAGPGVNINSTWKGSTYKVISGTSMATPHVAGAAALYIAANPTATPADVKAALRAAGELPNVNSDNCTGTAKSHAAGSTHPEPFIRANSL